MSKSNDTNELLQGTPPVWEYLWKLGVVATLSHIALETVPAVAHSTDLVAVGIALMLASLVCPLLVEVAMAVAKLGAGPIGGGEADGE